MADASHDESVNESDPADAANMISAYNWAVKMAQKLLDAPRDLRIWSGRHATGAKKRMLDQTLTFEDVPDLVKEMNRSEPKRNVHRWLASFDSTADLDEDAFDDLVNDTLWMLEPMLALEMLHRREAAFFNKTFTAANVDAGSLDANSLDWLDSVDTSEDSSEPPSLLTVPVELLAKILRRSRLTGATAFGLASKRSSARLFIVLQQAAGRKARRADAWRSAGSRAATRLNGCHWERWSMIDGAYGAYGGQFDDATGRPLGFWALDDPDWHNKVVPQVEDGALTLHGDTRVFMVKEAYEPGGAGWDDYTYARHDLTVGGGLKFTLDVSNVPCGCIACVYLVAMDDPHGDNDSS